MQHSCKSNAHESHPRNCDSEEWRTPHTKGPALQIATECIYYLVARNCTHLLQLLWKHTISKFGCIWIACTINIHAVCYNSTSLVRAWSPSETRNGTILQSSSQPLRFYGHQVDCHAAKALWEEEYLQQQTSPFIHKTKHLVGYRFIIFCFHGSLIQGWCISILWLHL